MTLKYRWVVLGLVGSLALGAVPFFGFDRSGWAQDGAAAPSIAGADSTAPAADPLTTPPTGGLVEGGDLSGVGPTSGTEPTALAATGESRDEYIIQSGDTLWDISARFFEKPEYWPRLWSYNQYITNPHLIFPNNKLVFRPGTETVPPSVSVEGANPLEPLAAADGSTAPGTDPKAPVAEGDAPPDAAAQAELPSPEVSSDATVVSGAPALSEDAAFVTLREDGYISSAAENSVGAIHGSFDGTGDLSENQEIYIKLSGKEAPQVGDMFTVFRPEKRVRGVGHLNKILGVLKVSAVEKSAVKARILRSYYPMFRGDKIRSFYQALHKVKLREASSPLKGEIIERLNYENIDIGQGDVVYIDRGNRDGVEPGYQFFVLRSGDGFTGEKGASYPNEIVGKLVIVVARQNNSTAVVTYSKDALHVGDVIATSVEKK